MFKKKQYVHCCIYYIAVSCRLLIIVQENGLKEHQVNSVAQFSSASLSVCLRESGEITISALLLSLFPSLSLWLLRLFETLQSLFWSVFGLLNLYVTNVKARHEFTEFVGATMFGTYNVISLVVLLNMLIAMMNNSYQLIAVSASKCNYNVRVYIALTSIVWDWK